MKMASKLGCVIVSLLAVSWAAAAPAGGGREAIVVSGVGFSTPESVEYDAAEDVYLVANINGSPFAAAGNGFISKLGPEGNVIDLKWINGTNKGVSLNAPKGMAVVAENLFVADINQVHVFALPDGQQEKSITIQGSTFLNGITPGAGGCVYVTDTGYKDGFKPSGNAAVYKVRANGEYELVVKGTGIGHPNGIVEDNGHLVIVTFDSGKMIRVDQSGKLSSMPTPPNGGLDGLVKLRDGRLLFSSWGGSAVYAMNREGKFSVLVDSVDAPADMGIDTKRNRVLIPLFNQNKVLIQPF